MKEKRYIKREEMTKRGCIYCADVKKRGILESRTYKELRKKGITLPSHLCKHEACPYRELDEITNYDRYCKRIERSTGGMSAMIRMLAGGNE